MLNYDYISDLHFSSKSEVEELLFNSKSLNNILVIGGDICNGDDQPQTFLNLFAEHYDVVLFVDGNHEHYISNRSIEDQQNKFKRISNNSIHYLFDKPYVFNDTAFVGCNGWYDFNCHDTIDSNLVFVNWKRQMNDYRCIQGLGSYNRMIELAETHANILRNNIKEVLNHVKNIIVVTHVAPAKFLLVPEGHQWYPTNGSFANTKFSSIIDEFSDNISTWHYGHTHLNNDQVIGGIRFINNAHGYYFERDCNKDIMSISVS